MASAEVVLKGELHSSRADLEAATELVSGGIDTLVLEQSAAGEQREAEGWFRLSVAVLAWLVESAYVSKTRLVALAEQQDADVVYTRQSDGEPLADAPLSLKACSAGVFYTLVPGSIWIGFATPNHLVGSLLLFLGLVVPVVAVRAYNAHRGDVQNRNQRIADLIAAAAREDGRVVAIVGVGHLDGIVAHLPADVAVDVQRPVYSGTSVRHARELFPDVVKVGLLVFSVYLLVVWLAAAIVSVVSGVLTAVLWLV